MQFSFSIFESDIELVKEKALAYLETGPHSTPPPPALTQSAELLSIFSGESLGDAEVSFAIEELAFDDFSRQVRWTSRSEQPVIDSYKVIIIGASLFGIAAAIQLEQLGFLSM